MSDAVSYETLDAQKFSCSPAYPYSISACAKPCAKQEAVRSDGIANVVKGLITFKRVPFDSLTAKKGDQRRKERVGSTLTHV